MAGRKNNEPSHPHPTMKSTKPVGCTTFLLLKDSEGRSESECCGGPHLEGTQSQLQGEANAQASTVRQEVEDDVVNSKQRDEEKG